MQAHGDHPEATAQACEDRSSEQTFYSAWAIRISSAMQRGTALMIHNIPLGNSIKSRRTKDVDIEPAAGNSGALGGGDGGGGDDDSGQLGSDSDSRLRSRNFRFRGGGGARWSCRSKARTEAK